MQGGQSAKSGATNGLLIAMVYFGAITLISGFTMNQPAAKSAPTVARAQNIENTGAPQRGETATQPAWVGEPPDWMADAVWYQVFVSRFRNGDRANDPPNVSAWDEPWFELRDGENGSLRAHLSHRACGGDLAGIVQSIDHFKSLGVNALYLNPIFEARSQHKYDTIDHRHVDPTFGAFGPDNERDGETLDPSTWQWTASDRVLLGLINKCHDAGIRVVLDGVFNHVGLNCFAWRDVLKHGPRSAYADWFDVTDWGPPIQYTAWDGPNGHLPEFRRDADGLHAQVETFVFDVVKRWMDPNGDGDPSDGVDGWRLDVAEKPPHAFWRRFRERVKSINPDAAIIGEIWPDATAWLHGDEFDCVTNYRFQTPVIKLIGRSTPGYSPRRFARQIDAVFADHRPAVNRAMMNLLDSHDTGRAVTMLAMDSAVQGALATQQPESSAVDSFRLAALIQFTFLGAPMIYYGDEIGMYGGNDPYCRAPMWWTSQGAPAGDPLLLNYAQRLGRLRRESVALRRGAFRWLLADDRANVMAFERSSGTERLITVINLAEKRRMISLNIGPSKGCKAVLLSNINSYEENSYVEFKMHDQMAVGALPPRSGCVLRVE